MARALMMGIYDKYILPHVINLACGTKPVSWQRKQVVPQASGRILEVGIGSGLNLPFYDPDKVDMVWGLEPSLDIRRIAKKRVEAVPFDVQFIDLPGEEIPLDDKSVVTVLLTYTLCTIPDTVAALAQMRRVLKPGGKLIFCEHGAAPDESVRRWQNRLNPYWNKIGGGCHLNREIPKLIKEAGFKIRELQTNYIPKTPKFAGFNYWGDAIID